MSKLNEMMDFLDKSTGKYVKRSVVHENKILFILDHVREGMTVVDAGACVGVFTILFSELVGRLGRVIAFEPEKRNYNNLVNNMHIYDQNCNEYLTCVESALSNYYGIGVLKVYDNRIGWHHLKKGGMYTGVEEEVLVTTLDIHCNENKIPRVDIIKMDVEGEDYNFLKGASRVIDKNDDIIIIAELHHSGRYGDQKDDIYEFITSRNFKMYDLRTDLRELKTPDDIFLDCDTSELVITKKEL